MSRIRGRLAMMLSALVVSSAALALPAGAAADTVTFEHTGAAQTWTVPADVTSATFDIYGAAGFSFWPPQFPGGKGGRATATLSVTPGQDIEIYVGGAGQLAAGGFNGGGSNGVYFGGGGATDIRIGGTTLGDRMLVAGGGGGNGGCTNGPAAAGGDGGGLIGGDAPSGLGCGAVGGTGGTQVAGGSVGGTAGQGGDGAVGGGGGGYFGGGGSGTSGAGGGGSGYGPPDVVFETGVREGNGLADITFSPDYDLDVSLSGTGTGRVISSPAGIDCRSGSGSGCGARLASGQITLSADAGSGSTFSGWSGAGCSGTSECIVTLDAAKTVNASFAVDPLPPDNAPDPTLDPIPPAPEIKITGLERDRADGTAILTVATNLGGALRVKQTNKVKSDGPVDLDEAGSAELQIVPRNGAAQTLRRTGRVTVNPRVMFAPAGGGETGMRHKFDLLLD